MSYSKLNKLEKRGRKNPNRKCLVCNYEGLMKTWLSGYFFPVFITILCFLFYILPGIIFIVWGWGKYKCPKCGTLNKNIPVENFSY